MITKNGTIIATAIIAMQCPQSYASEQYAENEQLSYRSDYKMTLIIHV